MFYRKTLQNSFGSQVFNFYFVYMKTLQECSGSHFFNFYCVPEDFAKHFGIQYFNFHRSYRSRTEDATMTKNKCSISNITKSRSLSNSMKNSSSSISRGIIPWGSLRNTMLYILFHSPPSISNVHMEWVWELFSWNWTVDIIEMLSLRMQRLDTSFKIELMPSSG